MEGLGVKVGDLSKLLGAAGLVMLFGAVKDQVAIMSEAFAESETAQLTFSAAIEASTKVSEADRAKLEELAVATAKVTGADDDAILGLEGMLIASGRTAAEIENMIKAAQGLAVATGTDLDGALTQLNATFSGTSGRLTKFTPELAGLTKEELANGAVVDIILEKYGALSNALQGSSQTSMANYETAVGNIQEGLGELIELNLKPLRDGLTGAFEWITANQGRILAAFGAIQGAIVAIVFAVNPVAGILAGTIAVISQVTAAIGLNQQAMEDAAKAQMLANEKAVDGWMVRAEMEKKGATLAEAMARAAAEKEKSRIADLAKKRGEAEAEYRKELKESQTRVTLGIDTENDAIEAKTAANTAYIGALIDLGYTGAAASKAIGDQELRDAVERNGALIKNAEDLATAEQTASENARKAQQEDERQIHATAATERAKTQGLVEIVTGTMTTDSEKARDAAMECETAIYDKASIERAKIMGLADAAKTRQETDSAAAEKVWGTAYDNISTKAAGWGATVATITGAMITGFGTAFESLGKNLADGETPWKDFGSVALGIMAEMLKAIGAQLLALAVLAAFQLRWVEAAALGVGAAAAYTAAGAAAQGYYEPDDEAGSNKEGGEGGDGSSAYTGPSEKAGVKADRYALGTDFAPGGAALVGERGRELVYLPRGSQVMTNQKTEGILSRSGGSNTFVFNSPRQLSPVEMRREFERTSRRLAFEGAF